MTGSSARGQWRVREVRDEDEPRWRILYRQYADFYRVRQPEAAAAAVWSWIRDPAHEVDCLLVEDDTGHVVGLGHYRPFARPLSASTGCFLDDLFIDPEHRGSGAVDALLGELRLRAAVNGWSVVRWITAEDNDRGRAAYDRHATRTTWITYDMTP